MNGSLGRRVRAALAALRPGRSPSAPPPAAPRADMVEQALAAAGSNASRMPVAATGTPGSTATGAQTSALEVSSAALRAEIQAALANVFTAAGDAILTVDANGRIMMFNHAAEQLFGCSAGVALGQPIARFCQAVLTEPDAGQPERLLRTGVAGWRLGEREPVVVTRADDRQLPVEVTVTPTTVRGVQVYTAAFRDVTVRVEMEQRQQETTRRLEQALADVQHTQEVMLRQERLKALGQLASGIAHDFNNALSMILGFTELLLSDDGADDPAKRRAHLQLIHSAAQDAAGVVGRLREFSRPAAASETLPPVQVNDLVAQAISLTQPRWRGQAQAHGQTIRVRSDLGQAPLIGGRASELREALANLIINAVDAMPDGGDLTLRTRVEEGMVVVEVADTGAGMPGEIRERIFDPFFTTKGDRGTGLGLPMVQGIVQQHGGEISVASEPGEGSIFTMRFHPLATVQEATPPPQERPRVRGLRVLLAEDEPSLRQILTSYLRVDGHAIEAVGNGEEALARYQPAAFDLIITDRAMPEMGGDQLAAELERQGRTTPLIMLTGLGDLMNEVGERPPGVDLVVAKPVTLAELRAAIVLVTADARQPLSS